MIKQSDEDVTPEQRDALYAGWTEFRDEAERLGDACYDITSYRAGFIRGWEERENRVTHAN